MTRRKGITGPTTTSRRREGARRIEALGHREDAAILEKFQPRTAAELKDALANQAVIETLSNPEAFWELKARFDRVRGVAMRTAGASENLSKLFFAPAQELSEQRSRRLKLGWHAVKDVRDRTEIAIGPLRPVFDILSKDPEMYSSKAGLSPVVETMNRVGTEHMAPENREHPRIRAALASAVLADTTHTLRDLIATESSRHR